MADDSLARMELDVDTQRMIDALCDEFENALRSTTQPKLEAFLQRVDSRYRGPLLRELLPLELDARADDRAATLEAFLRRLPEYEITIREAFAERNPAVSIDRLLDAITRAGLIDAQVTQRLLNEVDPDTAGNAVRFGNLLVEADLLTDYQRDALVAGKSDPVVLGDYIILDRIGRGGMGQVYKARHRRMERVVALKTLPDELAADTEALSRFHREVKAVARLSHPNIVTAHDAREDNGIHYLVMEYVPGDDLAKHVKVHGPMLPQAAAECILQAARGLEYAHQRGVIHRDVKPSNLLLQNRQGSKDEGRGMGDSSSVVKVLDLGLARIEHSDGDPNRSQTELTGSGAVMGTVDYMAPEQAQNTHNADQRSDIYSLGMTFYYLLTGQTAYGGSTVMERLLAHREQPIPSLESSLRALHQVSGAVDESSVAHWRGLDDVFRKMAAKKPTDRYQTMSQVIAELEPMAQAMGTITPTRPSALENRSVADSGRRSSVTAAGSAASDPGPVTAATIKPPSASVTADDTLRNLARERTVKMPGSTQATHSPPGRIIGKWVAVALLLIGIVASGIVYRIQTDHGTIVVEIEDDSLAALLTTTGIEVIDRNDPDKKWTIELAPSGEGVADDVPSGEYEVPVPAIPGVELHITDGEGAEYIGSEFKLTRGDEVRIRITAELPAFVEQSAGDADREVAEWVLSVGGSVVISGPDVVGGTWEELPLPEQPFHLTKINLRGVLTVTDADLLRFESLTHVYHLSLISCEGFTDAGAETIAGMATLREVLLTGTSVTDVGLAQIVRLPELRHLTIDSTPITEAGVMLLAGAEQLEELSLGSLPVSLEALRSLQSLPLKYLGLFNTPIRYADLPELVTLFPLLENFNGCRLQGEVGAGLSPLAELAHLERLTVEGRDITARSPHHLARFENLRTLYLHVSYFPTGVATELESLPGVTELYLYSPNFQEGAFSELCGNTTLERLEIEEWLGSDAEIMQLTGMENLRRLRIRGSEWTAAGAQAFHEQRPDVAITGDFNIPAEAVADQPDYAKEREVAEWVLSIGGTVRVVVAEGAERIVTALPLPEQPFQVVRIDFLANPGFSESDLMRLQPLSDLRIIDVDDCPQIGDVGMEILAQISSLEDVSLHRCAVTDAGLAFLARLRRLRALDLVSLEVTDQGLSHLAGCSHLEAFVLRSVPITIEGLRALQELPLRELIINDTQVQYSDLTEIVAMFPELRRFESFELQGDVGEGLSPLAQLPNLEQLSVAAEFVTAAPPHDIDLFPRLRELEMYYRSFPAGLSSRLEQLPRVTQLLLEGPRFEAAAFAELCANSTLEKLELRVWSGGDVELLELSAMPNLRRLVLQGTQVTAAGAQAFHELRPDVAITGDFNIPADAVASEPDYAQEREVAEWVLSIGGSVVVAVNAEDNGNDPITVVAASDELPSAEFAVVTIDLDQNTGVTDADLARIAELSRIERIKLYRTGISDAGIEHLIGAESLQHVHLGANRITDAGVALLARLPHLTTVDLQENYELTPDCLEHLETMPELTGVAFGDTRIRLADVAAMSNAANFLTIGTYYREANGFTQVSEDELVHLARFPMLNALNLAGSGLSDTSLAILRELSDLKILNLESNEQLTDAAVPLLAELKGLHTLDIHSTAMTQAGVDELHAALPNCTINSDFGTFGPQ